MGAVKDKYLDILESYISTIKLEENLSLAETSKANIPEDIEHTTLLSKEEQYKLSLQEEGVRKAKLERKAIKEANKGRRQDRKERKRYANKIFEFLCIYMFFVCLLLFLSGNTSSSFQLSDPVLLTILGTTTTNVLGTFYFVANYLFPRN